MVVYFSFFFEDQPLHEIGHCLLQQNSSDAHVCSATATSFLDLTNSVGGTNVTATGRIPILHPKLHMPQHVETCFTKGSPAQRIRTANETAAELFEQIKIGSRATEPKRAMLDGALVKRMDALRPLCQAYLTHRAELTNLVKAECDAAQGRTNQAELGTNTGPPGCKANNIQPGSLQVQLPEAQCTRSRHELLCTARLKTFAAGKADGGSSMDAQVSNLCNPLFQLPSKPLTEELARGMRGMEG